MKNPTTFVTGAGGFIGSHLVETLLKKGFSVKALVRYNSQKNPGYLSEIPPPLRKNLEVVFGNVENADRMITLTQGIDRLFHLAALIGIPYSFEAPECYIKTNILGTMNVLQAALKNRIKQTIVTSTSEVYGTAQFTPITLAHPLLAQSPYAASKIAADKLAESYANSYNLPVAIVRPFNTFGPRQSLRAVIPTIIAQALNEKEIRLGELTPIRDMNFVQNTVDGFLACMNKGIFDGRVYQLASGVGKSVEEIAREILDVLGKKNKIVSEISRVRPKKSEVRVLLGSYEDAETQLGWKPGITFRMGIKKTINWFEKNFFRFSDTKSYSL